MTIKVLDLFAGAGGLALGLELVRNGSGKPVFELYRAVELDKYACETLRENFGEEQVIEGDLTDRKVHDRVINECGGNIDIVAGGIPCQSFSLIGPRSGYGINNERFKLDKRDDLYKEFSSIVRQLKPKVVLLENVKGILSKKDSGGNRIIDKLLCDFEKLGYCFDNEQGNRKYFVLNAADFGVPQIRARVIIVGIRKDWKRVRVPYVKPTHYNAAGNSAAKGLLPYVTLWEAIGDLPAVFAKTTFTGLSKQEIEKQKTKNEKIDFGQDRITFMKKTYRKHLRSISLSGVKFFGFVRPNGYPYIDDHIARGQQVTDLHLFAAMKEGETAKEFVSRKPGLAKKLIKYKMDTFADKYRKQKRNAPCTTVFAHLEKDGNRFIHPLQTRTITPREAARIQSFPDDFIFKGPFSKKFKQIGNAVPPLMVYHIGIAVHKIFGGTK